MLCNKMNCTGCNACYNVCPKGAINMISDFNGFLYPTIDTKVCINCGLCTKVCPELNPVEKNKEIKVISAISLLAEMKNSTSGGIAYTLAYKVIEEGGIVFGTSFVDKSFKYIKVNTIKEINKLQGSRYVQCDVNDIFKEIKKELNGGKKVIFFGTPCYVAGLKNYLQKEHNNLVLVSFICGGVPSQKYLFEHLKNENIMEFNDIQFRNKNNYVLKAFLDDKVVYSNDDWNDIYMRAYKSSISLRESCYNCKYANEKRVGDITIGDFWGIENYTNIAKNEIEKGISTAIISTQKGIDLLTDCSDYIKTEVFNLDQVKKNNPRLKNSVKKSRKTKTFQSYYKTDGFTISVKKVLKNKCSIKKYIKKLFLKIIKR